MHHFLAFLTSECPFVFTCVLHSLSLLLLVLSLYIRHSSNTVKTDEVKEGTREGERVILYSWYRQLLPVVQES